MNMQYGELTITKNLGGGREVGGKWIEYRCSCGKVEETYLACLVNQRKRMCSDCMKRKTYGHWIGKKIGDVTVVSVDALRRFQTATLECSCGYRRDVTAVKLKDMNGKKFCRGGCNSV